jgi:mono/diheme cytochrome c family protein
MWSIDVKATGKRQKAIIKITGQTPRLASAIKAEAPRAAGRQSRRLLLPFTFCLLPFALLFSGCRQDMHDQPKHKPYATSEFFEDGRASRPLVDGVIPRGALGEESQFARTVLGEQAAGQAQATALPFPVTSEVIARGQERFNISCAPCHGRLGDGFGMIVRRGFRRPPSLHIDRLREARVGHFYDVITNGLGAMPSYADQIAPRDRWAIVAYISALQLSQRATRADVPPEEWQKLIGAAAPGGTPR